MSSYDLTNELFSYLRGKGVSWVRYQHSGKKKMIYLGES